MRVSLRSARPADCHGGRTVVGCAERTDGVAAAHLTSERYDAEKTDLLVTGVLSVLDHPARFVGAEFVPAWTEIRVAE